MNRVKKRFLLALGCAAIGFVAVSAFLPRAGKYSGDSWGGDFLGMSGLTLGAVGAGVGLAIGLLLALRRGSRPTDGATPPVETTGPSAQVRTWLRRKRQRDAPKRFGKRGN